MWDLQGRIKLFLLPGTRPALDETIGLARLRPAPDMPRDIVATVTLILEGKDGAITAIMRPKEDTTPDIYCLACQYRFVFM
jgi:hypothetical protein